MLGCALLPRVIPILHAVLKGGQVLTLCLVQPMTSKLQAPRSEGEPTRSTPSDLRFRHVQSSMLEETVRKDEPEAACPGLSLSTNQTHSQIARDVKNLEEGQLRRGEWKLEDIDENRQAASANTRCSPSLDIQQDWHSEHSLTMLAPSSNCKSTTATATSLDDESGVNKMTGSAMDGWLRTISLEQYAGAMKEYGYDSLEALDSASEADLEEMSKDPAVNMKKPHRRLLMDQWKIRTQTSLRGTGRLQSATGEWKVEDIEEVKNLPAADVVEPVDAPNKSEAQSRTSMGVDCMTDAFTATNTKDAGHCKPSGTSLTKGRRGKAFNQGS